MSNTLSEDYVVRALISMGLVVSFATIAVCDTPAETENKKEGKPTSFWMEKKMDYAQSILRGLATADFESIGDGARQMRLLNKVEGFIRKRNAHYRAQVHSFERVCDEMIRQAEKENLPGVTLAFNQLTVSCVNCHQTLRSPESNNAASSQPENPSKRAKNE